MPDAKFEYLIKTLYEATGVRLAQSDLDKLAATGARTKSAMEAAGSGLKSLASNADALTASLGVGAGVGAILALAHAEAQTVMETQRLSFVMGLSVEETSKWAFAAEQATGSSEALNIASFRAAQSLEEIKNGLGNAATAARKMGIDPDGLKGVPDLLLKISNFITTSALPNEQKLALTHELLGRSANALFPLLSRGAEGIKALGDEAEKSGHIIDQGMIETVKRFNLVFAEFQNSLKRGVGLPVLEFVVAHQELTKLALAVVVMTAAWKTFTSLGLVNIVTQLGSALIAYSSSAAASTVATSTQTAAVVENTAAIMARRIALMEVATAEETQMGVTYASAAAMKSATATTATGLAALGPAAIGALVVFDALFAIPKIISFSTAIVGLIGDIKRLSDAEHDEAALTARAQGAVERGRVRGAEARAHPQAAAATTAPTAAGFQSSDAITRLAGESEEFNVAKSQAGSRQEARSNRTDELKDAVETAPTYAARKAALKALHDYEIAAEKAHQADLVGLGEKAAKLGMDKEREATTERVAAQKQAALAVGKADEGEKRKGFDESVAKEKAAHTAVLQLYDQFGKEKTDSDKRQRDVRAKQISEDAADERKQHESHLESIVGNEKVSATKRIAAIRELAAEKKKLAGPGEREKIDEETRKSIAGIATKAELHEPSYQVDSMAKIGGFVGNNIPIGGAADKQSEMAATLKDIKQHFDDGLKIQHNPDPFNEH